ncbi:MAG TPA: hypothetical protein VMD99_09145 [Terriglobales bacterium]|nr:hypothetical protein [Terriglobales bacterium]
MPTVASLWLLIPIFWALTSPAASQTSPQSGQFDGPAELPRVYVESSLRATPATGKTLSVRAGEDPSKALSTASCGDTVELQAGATFGSLLLPPKNCDDSHWIVIRTSAPDSKLPAEGTRLTPCYAGISSLPGRPDFNCKSTENVLAKIEFNGRGGSGPVTFAPGANHYRLIGLEITRAAPGVCVYNLVEFKGLADHVIFDRVWMHGTAQDETTRGIFLGATRYLAVVDSFFTDFHCVARTGACTDAQTMIGGLGDGPMGPYKIVNNFLEAAGENILFGGGAATTAATDIEIRHNYLFKPLSWLKDQPGFVGGRDGSPFIVKNLFELKNAQRVLFEGNILEHTWGGFSQAGFGILLTPKNQARGLENICPSCLVTDVTIRKCKISHVASGFQIANGVDGKGRGAAKDGGRYSIHDVVVDDVEPALYKGFGMFAQISTTPGVSNAPRLHDLRIDHVTAFTPKTVFMLGGPPGEPKMSGLSVTNSIFVTDFKPVISTGGARDQNCSAMPFGRSAKDLLNDCFSSYNFHHNVIIAMPDDWPKDNKTLKNVGDAGFVDYKDGNQGNYRLSPSSRLKNAGSDHKDIGADVDAIEAATAGVTNL